MLMQQIWELGRYYVLHSTWMLELRSSGQWLWKVVYLPHVHKDPWMTLSIFQLILYLGMFHFIHTFTSYHNVCGFWIFLMIFLYKILNFSKCGQISTFTWTGPLNKHFRFKVPCSLYKIIYTWVHTGYQVVHYSHLF